LPPWKRRSAQRFFSRNATRLAAAVAELRGQGVNALPTVAGVAEAESVEAAATRIEAELGPIDVWVNNAMATIFAPAGRITAEEFRRATVVTYLGQVYGTMAALSRMRKRGHGTIINVGSALAYRAIRCNRFIAVRNTRCAALPTRFEPS
jgi:NAD(P)-dependent dehydrogenase (short-subunit alcohol dehydrogenase family)